MKRNTLSTAVVAGLTGMAGMVSVSNAVNVNPDGMGQVLLYPYYSARGGNDTLISIVNTTERGKAVKIRFIEALNSRQVLGFNIYMSPYDVWTAVVTAEGDGAKVRTADTTCTVPYFYDAATGVGEQAFLDFEYAPTAALDGGPTGIERTASGYIEVIEMGRLLATPVKEPLTTNASSYVAWAVKHDAAGVPNNCQALVNAWTANVSAPTTPILRGVWLGLDSSAPDGVATGFDTSQGPTGGLYGAASIINVAAGTMFSYNATAIDGFFQSSVTNAHTDPGSVAPSLASGGDTISTVFDSGAVRTNVWTASHEAVSAVITHDKIMNEYVTDAEIGARTEWVVTFPTKRIYTDGRPVALPPFTAGWYDGGIAGAAAWKFACEDFGFDYYNREEGSDVAVVATTKLCREANVIRFATDVSAPGFSEILKEPVRTGTPLGYVNVQLADSAGWVSLDLARVNDTRVRQSQDVSGQYVKGLPVIGFAVTTYTNGNLGAGVLANYSGTFAHRATRAVSS